MNKARNYLNAAYQATAIPVAARMKLMTVNAILAVQNSVLHFFQILLFKQNHQIPARILIFRTGSLGDSVCAIPSIRTVRKKYPTAAIDILTNTGKKGLAGMQHLLDDYLYDEIIDYSGPSKKELFKSLQKKQYDLIIQLPQVDASFLRLLRDLLLFRSIAPAGFGWKASQVTLFRKTQAKYLQFIDESNRLLALLKQYRVDAENEPFLNIDEKDLTETKDILQQLNVPSYNKLIAVVVGAKRPQNRWPIAYFKQVVEHFAKGYTILLIGSGEDNSLVEPLLNIQGVINTCGKLTPLQSAAAMSLCLLTISNDTGPMHLSYAVHTPTLALFSCRDLPGKWYPPENIGKVFRATDIPCQACFSETCADNICMKAILPKQVIDCAVDLLKAR